MRKRTSAPKRLLRSALTAAALGAGFLSLLAPNAQAAGAVYQQHVINAGVLVDDTNGQGDGPKHDPAPYLFYVLNNRTDVRPPDLTLVNPLAPTSITAAILNRWTPGTPAAPGTAPYRLGQPVTPDMAPYWEVPLNSVSDNELSQFNVLYLRPDTISYVIPAINEKLRRFVNNGGQLIVEYGFTAAPPVGLWTGTGATVVTPPSPAATTLNFPAVTTAVIAPPVVTQPYFLSLSDLTSLFNTIPVGQNNNPPLALAANGNDILHSSEFTTVFSPALTEQTSSNPAPVVSTAQIGAGQVVASALRIGPTVSPVNTPNSSLPNEPSNVAYFLPQVSPQTSPATVPRTPVPSDFYNAPAADLKLLTNMVELSETHPGENKTSYGNASNAGLASFSPAWQFPVLGAAPTAPTPGAAVWGNFVFVTDAAGTLHAFDAFPSENLTNNLVSGSTNDDGSIADFSQGKSYDELWNKSINGGASAPTVASFNGVNYVFVENSAGAVAAYNAVTGAAGPTLTTPTPLSQYPAVSYSGTNVPSPTVYEGRVYAGQANGTLSVYDLSENTSAAVPLDPNTGLTEPVVGPPAVGTITDGDTNVLVAAVSTPYSVYSVLAGARNEPMKQYLVNNAITGYSINRSGRYDLNNIFADTSAITPPLLAYDNAGNVLQGVSANNTAPSSQDPLFSITTNFSYYTDWNMDFASAAGTNTPGTTPSPVNLNYVSTSSYGQLMSNGPTPATVSAPAVDRHGDYYFTETNGTNSYLVGVTPAPLHNNVHIKFRFLIPQPSQTPFTDADNVNYGPLAANNLHFVGAPVVDDQDNVYALATNGTATTAATSASVLCFRANQQVTAVITGGSAIDLTQAAIQQSDEGGTGETNTIQPGPDANVGLSNATYGQFISSLTTLAFYNFGKRGRTAQEIAGNVTEPQIMTATDNTGTGNTATLGFRTNLAWFLTPFTVNGPIAGLSQVGGSLFLSDGTALYRIPTNPSVGTGKQVAAAPFKTPIGLGSSASAGTAGLGTIGAPPSIGGNVMVLNGTTGIQALTRQVTVIADSNRILGVDGDGAAVWSVDATSRTDPATAFATKVAFNHPTALSQFAVNDYLAADTGSNRCVRFDSAGNVRWELTRFSDPYQLMGPGQPLTLSQPSSVVVRPPIADTTTLAGTQTLVNPGGSFIFYLIADSGNNRIVEVEDRVRAEGTIYVDPNNPSNPSNPTINHQLTWVTHTGDREGRNYRYGSADYYTGSILVNNVQTPTLFVAATVVNTRLGRLTATGLGPVSGDAPGGSLVIFQRPQTPAAFSTVPMPQNDLVYTTGGFYAVPAAGSNPVPFAIRNPRFLKLFTPPVTAPATAPNPNVAPFDFLYADDNGVFDLTFNSGGSGPQGFVAGADRLQFTTANYQNMTYTPTGTTTTQPVPAFGVTGTISRAGLPFVPTCVQALSTDSQGSGSSMVTTRRYLITQSYSQGELGGPATATVGKIGGEVFEVDVTSPPPSGSTSGATTPGGFAGNQTLSHPDLTGPLIQPTYAVRLP